MLHSDGAKLHGVSIGGSRLAICSTSTWFVISAMPGRCLWLESTWMMWSAEDLVRVIDKTRKVIMRISNPAFAWRFMRAVSISSGAITKTTMSEFAAQPRVAPANLAWWLSVMLHWVFVVKRPEGWYFILLMTVKALDGYVMLCFFFWAATLKLKSALVLWMLLGACWFLGMANGRASLGFDSQLRHLDVNDVSTILFDSFKAKSHRCKVT